MVTCGICLEQTKEIGELECCDHRFCWSCITQWADRETRCPLCKQRFKTIKRKALFIEDSNPCAPNKRRKLNTNTSSPASATRSADADALVSKDSTCCPDSPKGRLEGVVLETKRVALRDQVYVYNEHDEQYANFLQSLHCVVCGGDENEEHLLICDGNCCCLCCAPGCDQGYHTYCVNRRTVPLGDWFCPTCTQQRRQQQQARTQRRATQQSRTGRQQGLGRRPSRSTRTAAATAGDTSHSEIDLAQSDLDESEHTDMSSEELERAERSADEEVAAGLSGLDDEDVWLDDFLAEDVFADDSDGSNGAAAAARAGGEGDADSRSLSAGSTRQLTRRATRQGTLEAGGGNAVRGGRTAAPGTRSNTRQAPPAGNTSRSGRRTAARASAASGQGSRPRQQESSQAEGRLPTGRVRLRTWQQLRQEQEPAARTQPVVRFAANRAAGADDDGGASGAGGTATVAVDQSIPSTAAAAAAGQRTGSDVHVSQEDAAWATFEQLRREHQQMNGSRPASGAVANRGPGSTRDVGATVGKISGNSNGRRLRTAQQAVPTGAQPHASGSAYFSNDSATDGQAQVRLRAALMARLQRQQQQQSGALEWSTSNPPDVKEPGYMDSIRDDLAAARARGEQMRRRRQLGAAGTSQGSPARAGGGSGWSPSSGSPSQQRTRAAAALARRGVGGNQSPGTSSVPQQQRVKAAAAAAYMSGLELQAAAARREDTQQRERARQRRTLQHTWQQSSRSMMGRWLSSAADQGSTGPTSLQLQNRTTLPQSARTVGAVRRGAAVAAGGGSSGAVVPAAGGANSGAAVAAGGASSGVVVPAAAAGVEAESAVPRRQQQQQQHHSASVVHPTAHTAVHRLRLDTGPYRIPGARWRVQAPHNGPLVTSSYFSAAQGGGGTGTAAQGGGGTGTAAQGGVGTSTAALLAAESHGSVRDQQQCLPCTLLHAAADGPTPQQEQLEEGEVAPSDIASAAQTAHGINHHHHHHHHQQQQQQHIQPHLTQQQQHQQQQYDGSNAGYVEQRSVMHSSSAQQSGRAPSEAPWGCNQGAQQEVGQQRGVVDPFQQHLRTEGITGVVSLGPGVYQGISVTENPGGHNNNSSIQLASLSKTAQIASIVPGEESSPQPHPPSPTAAVPPPPTLPTAAASPAPRAPLAAATAASSPGEAAASSALFLQAKDTNAAGLTRAELKQAKTTAQALAKARLASPYRQRLISKETYTAAAKAATHGLYEQVKAGKLQLQDLVDATAVAATAAASERGAAPGADADVSMQDPAAALTTAQVIHVMDLLLAEEGVARS